MKKCLFALLSAVMALSAGATALYVNGTKITGTTTFVTGGGTVSYNESTKVLTVEGVNFTRSGSDNNGIDNQDITDLTINFKGDNSITINNADVLNLRAKTTVSFSGGVTTLKCTAGDQNAIKARGADVKVISNSSATLNLISTNGAAIEGKNGTEQLTLSLSKCEITAGRQAFYNFGQVAITGGPDIQTQQGITSSTSITIKGHTSDTYLHADNITSWNNSSNVSIKLPEVGLSVSRLTVKTLTQSDVLITDEHTADNASAVGKFIYTYGQYDNEGCASMEGPTVNYKYTSPTQVTVPGFVDLSGVMYPVYVKSYALSGSRNEKWVTSVETVTYEFGVKYIGTAAMSELNKLKSVKIPGSVKTLGNLVMKNSGYTSNKIDIYWATLDPSAVKTSSTTFTNHKAQTITAHFATPPAYRKAQATANINNALDISTVALPSRCYDLVGFDTYYYIVTAWDMQVGSLCELALVGCSANTISLADNNDYAYGTGRTGAKLYRCTSVAPEAFSSNSAITSVSLTSSDIKTVGASAFFNCSNLTSVTFGYNIKLIDTYAFSSCPLSGTVEIQSGRLGVDAFRYCKMTGLTIGSNVDTIGDCAFADCKSLQTLSIKHGVSVIKDCAFARCSALREIVSTITDPTTLTYGPMIFTGVDKYMCVLNIPSGTYALYKATDPWSEFFNIVDPDYIRGDVNSDGAVNSGDVSAVYNVMLGITTDRKIIALADVNNDGSVNAGDVSTVYEIMLGQ